MAEENCKLNGWNKINAGRDALMSLVAYVNSDSNTSLTINKNIGDTINLALDKIKEGLNEI